MSRGRRTCSSTRLGRHAGRAGGLDRRGRRSRGTPCATSTPSRSASPARESSPTAWCTFAANLPWRDEPLRDSVTRGLGPAGRPRARCRRGCAGREPHAVRTGSAVRLARHRHRRRARRATAWSTRRDRTGRRARPRPGVPRRRGVPLRAARLPRGATPRRPPIAPRYAARTGVALDTADDRCRGWRPTPTPPRCGTTPSTRWRPPSRRCTVLLDPGVIVLGGGLAEAGRRCCRPGPRRRSPRGSPCGRAPPVRAARARRGRRACAAPPVLARRLVEGRRS